LLNLDNARRLSGGASRETWEGERDGRTLILRKGPGMKTEAALIAAAAEAGVPVPQVVEAGDDYLLMERIEGETIPRKILRDPPPGLARQCGEILARLHTIDPPEGLDHTDQLKQFRTLLDTLGQPHPAFEIAFRWLDANRPPPPPAPKLVHGDFRNGNLVVGPDGIRAVLDWELAHAGDPIEDLGWLCVKSWRFGVDQPVGGFGTYDELLDGYGRPDLDRDHLRWWEVMGTLKWGIMCILQATAHTSGAHRSVELAAIGRRVCEVEWDLLQVLPRA
jgi:aminoglycoside phosphotransferase (APT) family kinase protein